MLPTMEALGFVCPNYYNPADFILKLSSRRLVDEVRSHEQQGLGLGLNSGHQHLAVRQTYPWLPSVGVVKSSLALI